MAKLKSFYDPSKTYDYNFDNGPFPIGGDDKPYVQKGTPQFTFLGKPVYSPFGIPAGPLLNSKYVRYAFERGFDVVVYKTQRSVVFPCNPFPNILFMDIKGDLTLEEASKPHIGKPESSLSAKSFSITNSFASPSRGPGFWVPDFKKAKSYQGKGQLLISSVQGTIQEGFGPDEYYDDFAVAASLAKDSGAEVIEINLSCPNVATEGVICYQYDAVANICRRVKERVGDVPLIIKIGYFSGEQGSLLEKIVKDTAPYVSAISSINTIAAPVVDEKGEQALPGPNRLKSGICGAGIKWAGLDMVGRLADLRKKFGLEYEIIGVGGVMTADDFLEYRKAGADLVQSATGAMWNPALALEIKHSLQ
jgi:dihydroorotate dehydrogenase